MRVTRGIAEALPFRESAFDVVSMGYALRYLADVPATLAECLRVLRPGGRLVVLELVRPASRAGRRVARFYLDTAVPWLSGRAAGADVRHLMRHCWATIEQATPADTLRDAILRAGFEQLRTTVWFGLVREQVATKPHARPTAGLARESA
jgi:demethylmenaquinone methyltransferase/2-methoxy-6-polyprenyl-1,4-benzoquinol methylase